MEPAAAHVAVEALQLVADQHAGAAGDVEGHVDDPLGRFHRPPLHRVHLRHPRLAVVDAGHPVGDEALEGRRRRVELEVHLGDLVLHERVVGVGAARDGHRRLAAGAGDGQLEGAVGDAEVHGGDERQRPHRHGDEERVAAVTGGDDPPDAVVGHEHAVEDGVVALGRAHAQRVPRLDHRHAGARRARRRRARSAGRPARRRRWRGRRASARPGRWTRTACARSAGSRPRPARPGTSTGARGCRCRPRRGRRRRPRRRRPPRGSSAATCRRPARSSAAMPIQ